MSIKTIGQIVGAATSSALATGAAALSRIQGRRGLIVSNGRVAIARSLQAVGAIRIRNKTGLQGDPEIGIIPGDFIYAKFTVQANGGAQQFTILPEVDVVDILEVDFLNPVGHTTASLNALRGGFYTMPPQSDGTPYPGSAIVDRNQAFGAFPGGFGILPLTTIREMRTPVDVWWIPLTPAAIPWTFDVIMRATCYWQDQAGNTEFSPSP